MKYLDDAAIKRLPLWTQTYIANLRREVENLEGEIKLNSGPETSNVTIETHLTAPVRVRDDHSFRFHAVKQDKRDRWIEAGFNRPDLTDRSGQGIRIYGDDSLFIEPVSSNVVLVKLR